MTVEDGPPTDVVLRIHPRYVSRRRLRAVQRIREEVSSAGLIAPVPLPRDGSPILRCGPNLAELETYVEHAVLPSGPESQPWLFEEMGRLHRVLAGSLPIVPGPRVTFFASPSTHLRWIERTRDTLIADSTTDQSVVEISERLRHLTRRLRRRWIPAARLPSQPVHGDINVDNVGKSHSGAPVYLDFGQAAQQPRIFDLAYTLVHTVFVGPTESVAPTEMINWRRVAELIHSYEDAADRPLLRVERKALPLYVIAALLQLPASAWLDADPPARLVRTRDRILLGHWLLDHPDLTPDA